MNRRLTRTLATVLLLVPLGLALLGPAVATLAPDTPQPPFGPSSWSPFGTDRLGRDVLAAALQGGRTIVVVTAVTVLGTYLVGFVIGLAAAATPRSWLDDLLMRPVDVLLCMPSFLLVMVAALRSNGSTVAMSCAIGLALLAPITRFVRAAARSIVHGPVMDALVMQGEGVLHRYGRYAVREMARPLAADMGVRVASAVYFLSSANFLGIGVDTTRPDWAVSVSKNKDGLLIAPWSVLLPASLIVMLVVGLNLLTDDLLADPRTAAVRRRERQEAGQAHKRHHEKPHKGSRSGVSDRRPHGTGERAPVVLVRGLRASAGGISILRNIDLRLDRDEVLTLFGPSGAGKTSVACSVAGIDQPEVLRSGTILIDGIADNFGSVGYLPQHAPATLNPARRVDRSLIELIDLHHPPPRGRAARRAHRRSHLSRVLGMAAVEVEDAPDRPENWLHRYPFEFSGGQRTRLALAQVLTADPSVIVLDEPTVGLDALSRERLVTQLASLRAAGIAVLLVTHDRWVSERLSDRTLHIMDGQVDGESSSAPGEPPARPQRTAPRPWVPGAPATASPREPLLRVRDLHIGYHGARALCGMDLQIHAGELVGLIGVSGAGKSTLARCIAGLVGPDHGQVLVDGGRLPRSRRRSRAQLALVQYVWQESAASFEPRRPVLDQIAAPAIRLHGTAAAAACEQAGAQLESLNLPVASARRYPSELSGGQLQRAAVARALMSRPRILVCDEIITGLDEPLSHQVLDALDAYRWREEAAVLSISHDLTGHFDRADRIALLDRGRVVETGTPTELTAAPATDLLDRLLSSTRGLSGRYPAP